MSGLTWRSFVARHLAQWVQITMIDNALPASKTLAVLLFFEDRIIFWIHQQLNPSSRIGVVLDFASPRVIPSLLLKESQIRQA